MKIVQTLMIGSTALMGTALVAAQAAEDHVLVPAGEVAWSPAPPVFPAGAEIAMLFGDPSKEGQFALRLKLPADYHVAPHTHPAIENVTVLSGDLRLGMGETADEGSTQSLASGSFVSMPPGMAHYVYTDGETVLQLNSVGPWGLTYVNPADDPRKTQ